MSIHKMMRIASLAFACLIGVVGSPAQANKSGVSPNVLVLPSGPGSIGGVGENVRANLNMGMMSYPIKILVPKGRGMATPSISVNYSSSAGAGLMGIGWGLNAGASISRLTVRGLPKYDPSDSFYAGSELVKIPGSPFYRNRMEGGFVRHRWVQTNARDQRGYWLAEYPDGGKAYYGADSKGKIDLNSQVYGLNGTFRWELRTKLDRNGNRIEYSYFKVGTQSYLERISWVFSTAGKPLYEAHFRYEDRPDPISDGKPGFDLQTTKRVKEIYITSGGKRFRSYQFTFEAISGLTRLVNVKRYGSDAKKMHPVNFTMKYSNATFSKTTSRMVTLPTSVGIDFRTGQADLVDINGDGLPDIVDTSKQKHLFHINVLTLTDKLQQKTHDFPKSKSIENPAPLSAQLKNPSVQMLDINGDGYTDMVDAVTKQIYINRGNSKWEVGSEKLSSFPVDGKDVNMRFFEYNGDKAIDVISSNGDTTTYWVSDKKGGWKRIDGGKGIGASFSKDKVRLIDINGDGLSDAVQIIGGKLRYKKYLGYGKWSQWIDVKVPGLDKYKLNDKAQFSDINGDGMADMVAFLGTSILYFVNRNGVEFAAGQQLNSFDGVDIPDSTKNTVRIADINGNGSRDIVWITSSGKVTYLELFSRRPNLLTDISNGIGQRITVEYGSSVYHRLRDEAKGRKWKSKLPMAFTVLNVINTWAQNDKSLKERPTVQRVFYHDGFYDGKEKKFRGFREVENVFDGDTSVLERKDVIFYNVGDTDTYFHGKTLRRTVTDGKGKIYSDVTTKWEDCGALGGVDKDLKPPVRYICMRSQEQVHQEGLTDKSKFKTTRQEYKYDGYGNMILSADLGIKDTKGDEQYMRRVFITPKDPKSATSNWQIRAVKTAEYCEDLSTECAIVRFYYDGEAHKGLPLGQVAKGNLVRTDMKVNAGGSEYFTPKSKKFDKYGNVIEIKTSTGALRVATWDSTYHKFPETEKLLFDKKTFTASTRWDYALNQVRSSTDFNGNVSFYTYDSFGRVLSIGLPGDTTDKPNVSFTYDMKAPINRLITKKRSKLNGALDREEIKCIDGLGRTFAIMNKISDGKYTVTKHTEFNSRGKPARVWDAYTNDGKCSFAAPSSVKFIQFFYDSLLRPIRSIEQNGSVTRRIYTPLQVQQFDQEDTKKDSPHFNTPKTLIMDGLKRVITKIEMPDTKNTITTKFRYSLVNVTGESRIIEMTFPDGSKKKHEYNLLGNPVRTIDPDRSTIMFKYDKFTNLIERTDARGITILYTYDALARKTSFMEKGKPGTKIEYVFDTPQPGLPKATQLKGRISSVKFPGGFYLYSYDNQGNTVHTHLNFMGVPFDLKREYSKTGEIKVKTFPDGRKANFEWDELGRIIGIKEVVKEIKFAPRGNISSWTGVNGVVTKYNYDEILQIKGIDVGGGQIMKIDFTLDLRGNPTEIKESFGGASVTNKYTYDSLYRLLKAELNGKETITYSFNDMHNITNKTSSLKEKSSAHIGAYGYDKEKVHAVSTAGKHKLTYTKAGHMETLDKWGFSWDFQERLTEVKQDGAVVGKSWYAHGKRRIMREENGIYTFYPYQGIAIRGASMEITFPVGARRSVIWKSSKFAPTFYDDLAPASGDKKLTAKPDGKITAADAWLFHAAKTKIFEMALKKRPVDVDLSKTMLKASVDRLLDGEKDVKRYLHADHLGNVRAVTDDAGKVVARYDYLPYGAVQKKEGVEANRPMFNGAEWDALSGTYYFGARFLHPTLAKWLSPDPVFESVTGTEGEFNSYGAFSGNPIANSDLIGTESSAMTIAGAWLGSTVSLAFMAMDIYTAVTGWNDFKSGSGKAKAGMVAAIALSTGGAALSTASAVLKSIGDEDTARTLGIASASISVAQSLLGVGMVHLKQNNIKDAYGSAPHRGKAMAAMGVRVLGATAQLAGSIMTADDPNGPGWIVSMVGVAVAGLAGVVGQTILSDLHFQRAAKGKNMVDSINEFASSQTPGTKKHKVAKKVARQATKLDVAVTGGRKKRSSLKRLLSGSFRRSSSSRIKPPKPR